MNLYIKGLNMETDHLVFSINNGEIQTVLC